VTSTNASGQPARTGISSRASSARQRDPRQGRGWLVVLAVVVVVAAMLIGASAAGVFRAAKPAGTGGGYKTGTATVTRQSLTSQTQVNATLGDVGSWTVVVPQASASSGSGAGASPTFTWLPRVGRTIRQGQVIYRVSGSPVVLLYGDVPAYRDLSEGMTGADVADLNADLVKLGYATAAALGPRPGWDYYSAETAHAVGLLQAKVGLTETGTLSLGEAAFLPGPALITGWGGTISLGIPAAPGTVVATASSTTPVVTIDLDAGQQSEVQAGDPVSITLPGGATTAGVISQITRVATSSSSDSSSGGGSANSSPGNSSGGSPNSSGGTGATITVLASLKHPKAAGKLNSAPVLVTITTGSVSDVLTVPVAALLARPGGGYAVEVTGPDEHHLVKVTPGLFDDAAGLVQVTGNLTPGQHVVVPGI
jgi:hypothetical protein